jgi:ParB-like chromosome segregation protein Spo0J
MTIDEAKEAEIRHLHFAEHWKVGTIVSQLGLHHDAVERVLGLGKGARAGTALPGDAIAQNEISPLLRPSLAAPSL